MTVSSLILYCLKKRLANSLWNLVCVILEECNYPYIFSKLKSRISIPNSLEQWVYLIPKNNKHTYSLDNEYTLFLTTIGIPNSLDQWVYLIPKDNEYT